MRFHTFAVAVILVAGSSAAAQTRFVGLREGIPGTGESPAWGVSADGRTVVGRANVGQGVAPFRWRENTGLVSIPRPAEWQVGGGYGVSDDGETVVGTFVRTVGGTTYGGFRWTSAGGYQLFRAPTSTWWASVNSVSGDGATVAGGIGDNNGSSSSGAYWTTGALPTGTTGRALLDVSSDGSRFVGRTTNRALVFEPGGQTRTLEPLAGDTSTDGFGISRNGVHVLGASTGVRDGQTRTTPFIWTEAGGMEDLHGLPGYSSSFLYSIDDRGETGVGYAKLTPSSSTEAIIWTRDTGMVLAADYFRSLGLNLDGWNLQFATDISSDGRTLVGFGIHAIGSGSRLEGFVATIPSPSGIALLMVPAGLACARARRRC